MIYLMASMNVKFDFSSSCLTFVRLIDEDRDALQETIEYQNKKNNQIGEDFNGTNFFTNMSIHF